MNATPLDSVFANRSEEEEIYPLTTVEIAEAQRDDATYKLLIKDWRSNSLRTHYVSAKMVG